MDLPKMLLVITKGINMVDFPRPIMIIMLLYPRPSSKQLDLNDKNGGSMGISWNIPIFVYILYIYMDDDSVMYNHFSHIQQQHQQQQQQHHHQHQQ